MAAEQSMTHAIMQAVIEATKAAIMAIREADNLVNNARPVHTGPRSGSLALKQSTSDCKGPNKYQELCTFEKEIKKIFMTINYNTQEIERILIILNCLG